MVLLIRWRQTKLWAKLSFGFLELNYFSYFVVWCMRNERFNLNEISLSLGHNSFFFQFKDHNLSSSENSNLKRYTLLNNKKNVYFMIKKKLACKLYLMSYKLLIHPLVQLCCFQLIKFLLYSKLSSFNLKNNKKKSYIK